VTDPATTSRMVNRHVARTLSWLEERGCTYTVKKGMAQWWVFDETSKRIIALCPVENEAVMIVQALNKAEKKGAAS